MSMALPNSSPLAGRWQRAALTEGVLRLARLSGHTPSTSFAGPPPRAGEES